ncbi:hydrolase [Roseomonas nepalensis]|uniref:Hydrolase n=2 Tax=Muricoccus nepalensis TaxID=1854500 RepID=A0A502G769_9PROT|nr:hydrolase [Roseomonas nepalensis]
MGVAHSPVAFEVPAGACDCHVHVFGPAARYPLDPARAYTPGDASVEELLALHDALGIERVVIVHPSPYGTDNRCTLDAARRLGERARAVAVIDEGTADAALEGMHADGVRGVRVNLETAGQHDPAAARSLLERAAARVAPLGWHVQTYTNLGVIAALHEALLALPVPLVVDHFGRARAAQGPGQVGFGALLSLLRAGRAYVKISAPHRISDQPGAADAGALARALFEANPDRVVWGTDWPHPGGARRDPAAVEPFDPIDDGAALSRLADWFPDPVARRRILVENPARLYGFG